MTFYQVGGDLPSYNGYRRYQRGYGFFSRLFSFALPLLKKALPALGKEAMRSSWDIAKEAVDGNDNIKSFAKKDLKRGLQICLNRRQTISNSRVLVL